MTLLEILKDIRRVHVELQDPEADCRRMGICHNVYVRCGGRGADFNEDLYALWAIKSKHWYLSWPLYTGEAAYPVPGIRDELSERGKQRWDTCEPSEARAERAALAYDYSRVKWCGVYGYQRALLLDHLIRCAQEDGV